MKLNYTVKIVQTRFQGPWRWLIVSADNKTVAASPVPYSSSGRARQGFLAFKRALVKPNARVDIVPNHQMELFAEAV